MMQISMLQALMVFYIVLLILWTGLCFRHRPRRTVRRVSEWAALVVTLILASELTARTADHMTMLKVPNEVFLISAVLLTGVLVLCERQEWVRRHHMVTAASIRQALDNLEDGLCFADETGSVVLTNHTMLQLAWELTDDYLRSADTLWSALTEDGEQPGRVNLLTSPTFRFSDDRIFRFTRTELRDETGKHYTELRAADVTALYHQAEALTQENRRLRELHAQLTETARDIAKISNEEELLSSKLRVHDRLGELLIVTRAAVADKDIHRGDDLVNQWKEVVSGFRTNLLADQRDEAPVSAVGRLAEKLDFTITSTGDTLWEGEVLAFALREAMYNAMRHADADGMMVHAEAGKLLWRITVKDNGKRINGPITEGGGLTNLRRQLLRVGGRLEIDWEDGVVLTLYLPKGV